MKTIIIILLAICTFGDSSAQTPKQELLDLLNSKHNYERVQASRKKNNISAVKTKYLESYTKVKGNKRKILSYIDDALKSDATALKKEFIFYNYQDPLSSTFEPENRISLFNYFKIVKYSLENSKASLPPLKEVPTN